MQPTPPPACVVSCRPCAFGLSSSASAALPLDRLADQDSLSLATHPELIFFPEPKQNATRSRRHASHTFVRRDLEMMPNLTRSFGVGWMLAPPDGTDLHRVNCTWMVDARIDAPQYPIPGWLGRLVSSPPHSTHRVSDIPPPRFGNLHHTSTHVTLEARALGGFFPWSQLSAATPFVPGKD